ncbi:ESPR-type extended signal peptide-containing protein [Burkholderia ubonensis]|uniref:ESPR-type extended signal peptide-containing protein n=1 Tax=Burkholderia ubonensis TaxID=101571 RepID=UPI0009B4E23B
MEKNNYRLVFSRVRGMLIAVEETASASGNAGRGDVVSAVRVPHDSRCAMRYLRYWSWRVQCQCGRMRRSWAV